ncbi:DUF4440 domain-containing protein [Peribacillus alkalitolerans]|uniref:nuclear transport factor 2 family protein n=1 Tax=Peribacillus alkalitolerans TaxID=1550385 RepID=UPI0013D8300B|nr:DUF4440 domain-containing protein [Peribacillus alkalitolerans]
MTEISLIEHLRSLEEKLLQPEVRESASELDQLLSDEFKEFGSSGRTFNKESIIEGLTKTERTTRNIPMTLSNFDAKLLAPGVALTTFHIYRHSDNQNSLRSSIWKLNGDQWQMYFHQGTPTEFI